MNEVHRILSAYASGEPMCAREVADRLCLDIRRVSTRTNMLTTRKDLARCGIGRPVMLRITEAGLERLAAAGGPAVLKPVAMVERAIRARPALATVWGVSA